MMDARNTGTGIALAVDLDGTLIASDLLFESLFLLLRANPAYLFLLPVWYWRGGMARLKSEIAERVMPDIGSLPYREAVLEEMRIGHIRTSKGYQLSGGERRRVEIARALAHDSEPPKAPRPTLTIDPSGGEPHLSWIHLGTPVQTEMELVFRDRFAVRGKGR